MTALDPMHFDGLSATYAEARPPYPAQLWADVRATGLLEPGRRGLDLGAGTGQATEVLLAHGMEVLAVEPGEHLADLLAQRLPRATVLRARAEEITPEPSSIDLAVIATAIHWMDLGLVLPMLHRALAPEGRLLVWRNVFSDPEAEPTPFRRAVGDIVALRGARPAGTRNDAAATAERIEGSGLFEITRNLHYRWTIELTTAQVRALFQTFSDWSADEVESAAAAVDRLGGSVTEHYTSWMLETRRI